MDAYNSSSNLLSLAPPSAFLPPLARLATQPSEHIQIALRKLQYLHWPPHAPPLSAKPPLPKRTFVRLTHDHSVPDSGYASAEDDSDEEVVYEDVTHDSGLELLRSDTFERTYAIKWLTGFIARSDIWISTSTSQEESDARTALLDNATSILVAFSGSEDDAEVAVTRSFSFFSNGSTIQVELNDAPLSNEDYTSVGLQSWGSSILLAERICAFPTGFSLDTAETRPLRVLELGAGTGLLSITVANILQGRSPTIVATDYHPEVLVNLSKNITTNFPLCPSPVIVHALDWESPIYVPPLNEPFDVIFAADVIYHAEHAQWIKGCVERILTYPNTKEGKDGGFFWLIIPLRTTGRHEGMENTIDAAFPDVSDLQDSGKNRWQLAVLKREEVGRFGSIGRVDERRYKLFKIGWL